MLEFGNKVAVKICGITSIADALNCAAAGADMLGLNFSPSSLRCITPETGAEVLGAARKEFPRLKFVGVFVDQEIRLVQKIMTDLALDAVQLHGHETPEYVRDLEASSVIKALRVSGTPDVSAYRGALILLDTFSPTAPGGTGETFPWSIATELRSQVSQFILAGGLTSANVAEAIRTVRPCAVDVCSGVESAPGRKDEAKVRAFISAVEEFYHEKTAIRA